MAVGRSTLAVSPQNGTNNGLRSEIKNFPGGTCPHMPHTPSVRALRALYAIGHMHTGTPLFKILDPPLLHLARPYMEGLQVIWIQCEDITLLEETP